MVLLRYNPPRIQIWNHIKSLIIALWYRACESCLILNQVATPLPKVEGKHSQLTDKDNDWSEVHKILSEEENFLKVYTYTLSLYIADLGSLFHCELEIIFLVISVTGLLGVHESLWGISFLLWTRNLQCYSCNSSPAWFATVSSSFCLHSQLRHYELDIYRKKYLYLVIKCLGPSSIFLLGIVLVRNLSRRLFVLIIFVDRHPKQTLSSVWSAKSCREITQPISQQPLATKTLLLSS